MSQVRKTVDKNYDDRIRVLNLLSSLRRDENFI